MDHYQLTHFEIKDAGNNNIVVLITGSLRYKVILQRAFTQYYFSRTFEDRFGRYEWGTYIYNIDPAERGQIDILLKTLQEVVCIEDDLTETFALGYHTQMDPMRGGYTRTELGDLVYRAKPYRRDFTSTRQKVADEIVERIAQFTQVHPTYAHAEIVAAVPPSMPGQPNLPVYLVEQLATRLGKANGTAWITKGRSTRPMKDCATIQEKIDNVRGAFSITAPESTRIQGRSVLVLDDIYQTGFTLNEVGRTLAISGAKKVLGLVITKTARDLR